MNLAAAVIGSAFIALIVIGAFAALALAGRLDEADEAYHNSKETTK